MEVIKVTISASFIVLHSFLQCYHTVVAIKYAHVGTSGQYSMESLLATPYLEILKEGCVSNHLFSWNLHIIWSRKKYSVEATELQMLVGMRAVPEDCHLCVCTRETVLC